LSAVGTLTDGMAMPKMYASAFGASEMRIVPFAEPKLTLTGTIPTCECGKVGSDPIRSGSID
jgi:hypothetical protein